MGRNITQEYKNFVKSDGDITDVVQDVIDKSQYSEGFLSELQALLTKYESPFHIVANEQGRIRALKTNQHGNNIVSDNSINH